MEEINSNQLSQKPAFLKKPVSLWIALILLIAGFGGGVLAGGGIDNNAQSVIKGADAKATST